MHLGRFFGRRLIVDYSLLKDFIVDVATRQQETLLSAQGSIMESAKVFESIDVKTSNGVILVSVYASLILWNRSGSPDFRSNTVLHLVPGDYEVRYDARKGETIFLKKVTV